MILDAAVITFINVPIWRRKLGLLGAQEILFALSKKVNEGDYRLSNARPPLPHHHPESDIDREEDGGEGGPTPPTPTLPEPVNYDNLLLDQKGTLLTSKGNVLWRPGL